MTVWYCFKRKRQLVKGEVDCDLAAAHKKCGWFELHPAGSRVVTAEALVIERDDPRLLVAWMDWAGQGQLELKYFLAALAQSKEGE